MLTPSNHITSNRVRINTKYMDQSSPKKKKNSTLSIQVNTKEPEILLDPLNLLHFFQPVTQIPMWNFERKKVIFHLTNHIKMIRKITIWQTKGCFPYRQTQAFLTRTVHYLIYCLTKIEKDYLPIKLLSKTSIIKTWVSGKVYKVFITYFGPSS